MLGDHDLNEPYEVEQLRRSVAMLRPRVAAFDREEALKVLAALKRALDTDTG